MQPMKTSPVKLLILIVFVLLVLTGIFFGVRELIRSIKGTASNTDQATSPTQEVSQSQNTTDPVNPGVSPTKATGQSNQPQQTSDGGYPVLVCDGSKPKLDVAFDSYAGFYPLVYRIMAMPASDHYCINLYPKWSGDAKYDLEESNVELMLRNGDIDIYFGSNGALALYDSNSGLVVWTTDQSAGADAIVARNSVATHFDKDNKPLPNFNDIFGSVILTSKGSADHFFVLKMMQTVGATPDSVDIRFSSDPPGDFINNGIGDFTSYWDPAIRSAMTSDTTTLVTTKYWRTINDYIVVNHDADNNMQDAVTYFLSDYNLATEAFTKDNLPQTAETLVNFTFNGKNMASWMFLDPAKPYESLNSLLDGVAIATLNDNATMFETDTAGSNFVKQQFDRTHITWLYGLVYDNGNSGALFNPDTFITDKYVKLLLDGGAKQITGEFNNKYDTDVSTKPPAVDTNTLIQLPEILSLPYKNIRFVPGESKKLMPGEEEILKNLLQPIANMMAESPDSVITVKGGQGFYTTDKEQIAKQIDFANRRAKYIRQLISDMLGVPIQRIVVDYNPIMPDHVLTAAEEPDYIVVVIKVINAGNFK